MCEMGQVPGLHRPRTKYLDIEKANLTYRKQRKHSKSQTRKITRRQLQLLDKILEEIRKMEREHEGSADLLTVRQAKDLEIVTAMYRQQHNHFSSNDHRRESEQDSKHQQAVYEAYCQGKGSEERGIRRQVQQHPCRRPVVHREAVVQCLQRRYKTGALHEVAQEAFRSVCKENRWRHRLCRLRQQGLLQGERHSDVLCQERLSGSREGRKGYVRQELARVRATRMEGSFGTLNVRSGNMQGRSHRSAQIQNIKRQSLNRRCAVIRVCLVHYSNNLRQLAILSFYKTKHKTIPGNVC